MQLSKLVGTALVGALALLQVVPVQASVAVKGVQNGSVQVRMELRTMSQQYPDMFNLYILGLSEFMRVDQSDPLSYYQIAGIHGRPYTPWDNVGTAPGDGGGYCTHTSNLFLPWHRPYLALFEQALYSHVQNVANSFPAGAKKTKYVAAAAQFRMPYWDWAAAPCSTCKAYPVLVTNQYYNADTPTGQKWVLNPLFRYDFHPISADDMVYDPFATWGVTKRYPTNWSASAVSQNNLVSPQIANNQVSARDRLYNLFTSYSNFSQFGNEAWISSTTTNADSLESLHDVIHAITGNNGHMTYLDYSAFDPIFWLHHAMIDRCFAMWQVLYPDSYVEPLAAVGATFTYPAGTVNDVNSPLPPFHSDTKGTSWTSAQAKNIKTFGYTYPELPIGVTQANVRSAINKLYGNTAGSTTVSKGKFKAKRSSIDNVGAAASVQGAVSENGTSYQYIANVVSQKFAMGNSYAVYLFMGNYSSNSTQWGTDPNLVGVHGVFANLMYSSSFSMLRRDGMADLKGTGSIPLTTMLIDKVATGQLASLAPEDVEPYLTHHLDWRASYYDGTEIPIADVVDLSISVVESQVQPAISEDEFPIWGEFVSLVNVTADKPGGHNSQLWDTPSNDTSAASSSTSSAKSATTATTASSSASSASKSSSRQTITIKSTTLLPLSSCASLCSSSKTSGLAAASTTA